MSKFVDLLFKYCPNGVKHVELGDIVKYEQPTKYIVKNASYSEEFSIPVLTAGQTFVLGYSNEIIGIYNCNKDKPVIIFDDFTTSFHWVDFNFKVKSSAMKILSAKNNDSVNLRFVYFAMKCILFKPQDHARQWISVYSKFTIPLPPLPIQQEIVSILDKFTSLEAELEAELEARKKQYEYYLNNLYTFEKKNVPLKLLGDIGEFTRGKRFVKSDITSIGTPCIHYGEIYTHYHIWANEIKSNLDPELAIKLRKAKSGDVIIVAAGETIEDIGKGVAWLGEQDVVFHDACFSYSHSLDPKYVSFFLQTKQFHDQIKKYISSGKISSINANGLSRALIPVPSKEEQQKIAAVLDKFNSLVNDISIGLPAEIESRRKQYEYYRNKLLDFKRLDNG